MLSKIEEECSCHEAFESGARKKEIYIDNVCIYGKIRKNNTITIRYKCTENNKNNVFLKYMFNNENKNIKLVKMAQCLYEKNSLCYSINLEGNTMLSLEFIEENKDGKNIMITKKYTIQIIDSMLEDICNKYITHSKSNTSSFDNKIICSSNKNNLKYNESINPNLPVVIKSNFFCKCINIIDKLFAFLKIRRELCIKNLEKI